MKSRIILINLILFAVLSSCNKNLDISTPEFEVSTDRSTYKVGDTIMFKFSGNPDYLTFYSGEEGNNYQYRERTNIDGGKPVFEFTSFRQWGTQLNTLKLLVSNKFNGKVDTNIFNQEWVDITDRATLSTTLDNTPSGKIDLSDFITDKPLYLAFKFTGTQDASSQRTWTIKNTVLSNVLSDKSLPIISSVPDASWVAVSVKNPDKKWAQNATQIQIAGGAANTAENEDWIVSRGVILNGVLPDEGVGIKDLSGRLDQYPFIFQNEGVYEVVFVATNANMNGTATIIKKLTITISKN